MELLKKSINNDDFKYIKNFVIDEIFDKWSNTKIEYKSNSKIKTKPDYVNLEVIQDKTQEVIQDKTQEVIQDKTQEVIQDKTQEVIQDKTPEVIQDKTQEVKMVKDLKDIKSKLNPIDLIKELYCYNGDNYEVNNILQEFLSKDEVLKKFKRKETSQIMQSLNENKWSINVCKLFSLLIENPILYRKGLINYNNYEGKPYIV